MLQRTLSLTLLTSLAAIGSLQMGAAAHQDDPELAAKIESAMTAAPPAISAEAQILDNAVDDAGKYLVLREGSNGWSCFPDIPASPGNDPACYDATWMDWNYAFLAGEDPEPAVPGLAYMLQGGSDPSNTDPMATEPAPGEDWVASPPHVMLLLPDALDQEAFSTDHDSGQPYIMWAGTPYEHIMMPIAAGDHMD